MQIWDVAVRTTAASARPAMRRIILVKVLRSPRLRAAQCFGREKMQKQHSLQVVADRPLSKSRAKGSTAFTSRNSENCRSRLEIRHVSSVPNASRKSRQTITADAELEDRQVVHLHLERRQSMRGRQQAGSCELVRAGRGKLSVGCERPPLCTAIAHVLLSSASKKFPRPADSLVR